ncbi:MAG: phenylalanine--tRNA ligase subunit alpha, partial [Pirellulaceae bacterium]|nr:phenylalanine--tRNA ligase subunit alpha [Pirellulaceae bacterium]
MALADFLKQLDELAAQAVQAFGSATDAEAVEAARVEYLGAKQGRLKAAQKGMGEIDKADRPAAGKRFNEIKEQIEAAFKAAADRSAVSPVAVKKTEPQFDPTVPGTAFRVGRLHPITQTIEELKDIMGRLGFSVADGPEVEDEWHNFEALNIPREHPARDPLDNFYLATAGKATGAGTALLRSQTSTVQIRVMEKTPPPIRIICLGRVYRPDTADAT